MKIVFTGLPYFSKKIVRELNEFDETNNYYFYNTYYSKIDQLKFLIQTINADLVISFNGVSTKSKSLDWALLLKKKILMQWHGTDVLTAIENKKNNTFTSKYIDYSTSYTDAEWLKEELKQVNILVKILHFKHFEINKTNSTPFKNKNALTYIAKGREKFYGIEKIIKLAKKFPNTEFNIVGTDGENQSKLANIIYHGWVTAEKMCELRNENAIFIRLTEHDGYSLSILEALANGNHVIWNNPHSKTLLADNTINLNNCFKNILTTLNKNMTPVQSNIEWIKKTSSKTKVLANLINTFKNVIEQ